MTLGIIWWYHDLVPSIAQPLPSMRTMTWKMLWGIAELLLKILFYFKKKIKYIKCLHQYHPRLEEFSSLDYFTCKQSEFELHSITISILQLCWANSRGPPCRHWIIFHHNAFNSYELVLISPYNCQPLLLFYNTTTVGGHLWPQAAQILWGTWSSPAVFCWQGGATSGAMSKEDQYVALLLSCPFSTSCL